jgi:hypothetical protein
VAKWLRRWRGEFCADESLDNSGDCEATVRRLRSVRCLNSPLNLLERLQELDCLSFSGAAGGGDPARHGQLIALLITVCLSFSRAAGGGGDPARHGQLIALLSTVLLYLGHVL